MQKLAKQINRTFALFLAGLLATSGMALAAKPPWAGGEGKDGKKEQQESHESRDDQRANVYFNDQHRGAVRDYYTERYRSGKCPPGLAKKQNGCMPPGQAKKWQIGKPLPRDVIFYDLPESVLVRLGPPPPRHRFVRVASDILMIAVGTGMIVDAIQDLNEL